MSAAFCLEARQTNLRNSCGLSLNNFAGTLKKIRTELDEGVALTSEQVLERSIFDLHLAKLFKPAPVVTKEANDSLMQLLDNAALSTLFYRNPVLHGHMVYLVAQRAVKSGLSRDYLDRLLVMLEGNMGFFLTPAQVAVNAYRESGQMLCFTALAMQSDRSADKFEFLHALAVFAATNPRPKMTVSHQEIVISGLWKNYGEMLTPQQWLDISLHFGLKVSEPVRSEMFYVHTCAQFSSWVEHSFFV